MRYLKMNVIVVTGRPTALKSHTIIRDGKPFCEMREDDMAIIANANQAADGKVCPTPTKVRL
ncbi:hypothetical protein ASG68_07475 [Rhizobium sp. Leaf453]|nr:hypothetical protein ASG42_07740 [Rhizobium sp. Leaf391]KQU01574.1 hypothetical protein ASG68_07475 [Rhizobium sp. Leaf453]